jgi:hypothetical protein
MTLNRFFTICVLLSVCALISTAAFAVGQHEAAAASSNAVASNVTEKVEPSPAPEIDFGSLFVPVPTNRSCTATSSSCMAATGSSEVSCTGTSSCSDHGYFVLCDSTDTYCGCNPATVPTCYDASCFCNCWNTSHQWTHCRQSCCLAP